MSFGPTTLQLGSYSWQNEYNGTTAFVAHPACPTGAVLDLNDGTTFSLVDSGNNFGDGLDWGSVVPTTYSSANAHSSGKRLPKPHIRNDFRVVTVKLCWGMGSAYTTWISALRTLIATCEGITQEKPGCLKVQVTQASSPLYLDVVNAYVEVPYDELKWAQLVEDGVVVTFHCQPYFRGPMQTLQNCATNPGFEAPSGPGVTVFSDTFANFNAYANQYYSIVLADAPVGFFSLNDAVGSTSAAEQSGIGSSPANMTATSITFGGTGAIQNDPNTSASASGIGSLNSTMTGLATGSANWSLGIWINIASTGHGVQTVIGFGDANVAHGCGQIQIDNSGRVIVTDGTTATAVSAALSTAAWHFLAATYDGVTLRAYIDGAAGNTAAATCAISGSGQSTIACRNNNGVLDQKYTGSMAYAAFYTTQLSAGRITALWNAGSTALAQDNFTFADTVLADKPLRYYRLDEAAGTTAYEAMGTGFNGTYQSTPTLGSTGLLAGDADTAITLNGTSQYVSAASTNLPTGTGGGGNWSMEAWVKPTVASAFAAMIKWGGNAGSTGVELALNSSNQPYIAFAAGTAATSASALVTGTTYHIVGTYDGTNLRLYVNGSLVAGPTAATGTLGTAALALGAQSGGGGEWWKGVLDECAIYNTTLSQARVTAHYNAGHNSPSTTANTMLVANGSRYGFGDPFGSGILGAEQGSAWTAVNLWQARFRYVSSLTASFYLHTQGRTKPLSASGASQYQNLEIRVTGTALSIIEQDTSGATTLATQSVNLTNGMQYWLQITQFPTIQNQTPQIQAILFADNGGILGSKITTAGPIAGNIATGPFGGLAQIAASGAALGLGGNFSAVHTVSLFGPGGWTFASSGTGVASGVWEQMLLQSGFGPGPNFYPILGTDSNLYAGGVTTSYGAAAITFPPTGSVTASWANANLTSAATIKNSALYTPTSYTWQLRAWVMSSNLPNSATIALTINEYNSSGALIGSGTVSGAGASVTGNQATYTQLVGTYTSSASTVRYFVLAVTVTSTASATTYVNPPIVWIENVQVWDSALGASMPYCELFFSQTPAQLLVSGILGDIPAPATLSLGTIGNQNGVTDLTAVIGRRSVTTASAVLAGSGYAVTSGGAAWTQVSSSTAYGGWYLSASNVAAVLQPAGLWTLGWEKSLAVANIAGIGTYEFYCRFLTGQTTPNIGNVTLTTGVRQDNTLGFFDNFPGSPLMAEWESVAYAPLSAASANWHVVDGGLISIPPYPTGVLATSPASYYSTQAIWNDTTGGGSSAQLNWLAAIPKDGGIIAATAYNISSLSSSPFFLFNDGITANLGLPVPWASTGGYNALQGINIVGQGFTNITGPINAAGGPGSSSALTPAVNPTADSYLTLDPALLPAATGGANQLVAIMTDSTGYIYPLFCQVNYSPLYLYPK